MKLKNRIIRRVSAFLLVVLTLWAGLFYMAMMDEITDEVDDALDLYTESVMTRYLAGKELPSTDNGTNNSYHLNAVSDEYAATHPHFSRTDEMLFIEAKNETEPARVVRTIFRRADGGYSELVVMTPTIEKEDLRKAIAYWVLGLYLSVVLTIIVVNAWVISRSMRPLYRLLDWLERYNINEQSQSLNNPTDVTEFQTLNDSIARFSQRNRDLFEQQKRFIGDASHELQTPLAICQSRLEMLCNTNLTEEQLGEILKTLQTLEHLSELNRSLLFLSKIDNRQFPECEAIDMVDLVRQTQLEYRQMAAIKQVNVTVNWDDEHIVWRMNRSLAKALVHNLYRNALVHNLETNGELHIYIGVNRLTFSNTGVSEALDEAHIFDRFYKAGGREHSTGLGLAIVAAICRHYELTINYAYSDKLHCFSIEK